MDTWFTGKNRTLGFMLIASILVCLLVPLVLLVVAKYFGLKIHLRKMNSNLSKLVTTAIALQAISRTEAKTLTDTEHSYVTDLTVNVIFAYEVLFILLVTYGNYRMFLALYRWYNFHNLDFVPMKET